MLGLREAVSYLLINKVVLAYSGYMTSGATSEVNVAEDFATFPASNVFSHVHC